MKISTTGPDSRQRWVIALSLVILVGGIFGGRRLRHWINAPAPAGTAASALLAESAEGPHNRVTLSRVAILYGKHCAQCHGSHGHGDGEGLRPLTRRPRDFRSDTWRFQKRRESIETVIREGIPGTAMPASRGTLAADDISELAGYVLTLAEGGSAEGSSQSPTRRRDEMLEAAGFSLVIPATLPRLQLVDLNGDTRQLPDIITGAAIVHIWSTTCTHCIANFPELDQAAERLGGAGISVISICTDQTDPREITSFAQDHRHIRFFVDGSGMAMHRFSTSVLPTMFLADRNRIIIGKATGHLSQTALSSLIESLSAP